MASLIYHNSQHIFLVDLTVLRVSSLFRDNEFQICIFQPKVNNTPRPCSKNKIQLPKKQCTSKNKGTTNEINFLEQTLHNYCGVGGGCLVRGILFSANYVFDQNSLM